MNKKVSVSVSKKRNDVIALTVLTIIFAVIQSLVVARMGWLDWGRTTLSQNTSVK